MQKFTTHQGIVAPLDLANVDTDQIIPKQFLKSIKRTGFGPNLFDGWRYLDEGQPGQDCSARPKNPEFILNQAPFDQASILIARDNFGCGSSREHAPWALLDDGFRVVIAPSFADIFYNNCFKNGILPVVLDAKEVDTLIKATLEHSSAEQPFKLDVNLTEQTITCPQGNSLSFEIDEFRKHCLLNGLDEIGLTLEKSDKIRSFEQSHQEKFPWLFVS